MTQTRRPFCSYSRRICGSLRSSTAAVLMALVALGCGVGPALAAAEGKPYDEKLFRLAEILGAVHYLRELCRAGDGQRWRDHMKELLDSEGATALRKARLTRSFNQGYRNYSRTYTSCTPSAQSAIERFVAEGVELSDGLATRTP